MDTRHSSGKPSRWELIWIQPARAVIVYGLLVVMLIAVVLGTLAYIDLIHRTQAVCDPLRYGQSLASQTTSAAGRGFARTFGASADKLGCPK